MLSSSTWFRAARGRRPARTRTAGACTAAAGALALLLAASPAEAQYTLASIAHDGSQSNGSSDGGGLSANGRFVVFASAGSNLVPNDTNGAVDIFVRDLVGNTIERIEASPGVAPGMTAVYKTAISDDGNIVIFLTATALVPEDTTTCVAGGSCVDLYAHDRTTHTTTLLTRGLNNAAADDDSWNFSSSADARYIAFVSAATNLVPDDTNGQPDIFVVDRTTLAITRMSSGPNGEQGAAESLVPAISADGAVVAFTSDSNFANLPACGATNCKQIFLKARATGAITSLPIAMPKAPGFSVVSSLALDAQGRTVAIRAFAIDSHTEMGKYVVWRHDVAAGTTRTVGSEPGGLGSMGNVVVSISRDGRYIPSGGRLTKLELYDHTTGLLVEENTFAAVVGFSGDGRYLGFSGGLGPSDVRPLGVYRYDLDTDGDGLWNAWETTFGLDPANPADAAIDSDDDGLTNLQEHQAGSHPTATHTRHFAEGVENSFFKTRFALLNPTAVDANVVVRLFGESGQIVSLPVRVGARARRTVEFTAPDLAVDGPDGPQYWPEPMPWLPGASFSAAIESDQRIVADRLTTWGENAYGSSLETSIEAPATTWHFAEGATGNGFSLYYLLSNPGSTDASVTVDYLRPHPLGVLSESVPVPAHSRVTVDVASRFPELLATTVSARLTATQPIVAERAMYRTTGGQFFAAGHAGAGVVAPAPRWFLAEGATGFFDEYVLVSNPGQNPTEVTFTFLPENAPSFAVTRLVPANSRYTLDVKEFPALANVALSIIVDANQTPIVVERAMWWPAGGIWYEASLSAGVTSTGTTWAIAEGEQSSTARTYVLVANTDPVRDGQAKITLLFENGFASQSVLLDVPHANRATLDIGTITPAWGGGRFGIIVEGVDGLPIVVERSLYHNVDGVTFAAGGTSVATNITPQF